ncbi:MAG: ABC transporter ATP-binding protein [Candidatus Thorarchaeota archaeon]|nr:ABC transporter ATP-binding protein [Candidatus Thorarchaeota archaeon]
MTSRNNGISIKTHLLSKTFGPVHAVRNVDLEVASGSRFGFLGPNGAGKTTTVRMLSGLMKPTSGTAEVLGMDILSQASDVRKSTGLLPESPGLYSKLSATEFLEFIGTLNSLKGEVLHKRIDRLLSLLGLEGRQDDLLETYSSGMKQKVLVASALLHEPRVVFLDEPTSRLDPSAGALVKDLIHALAEEMETTFFICTHQTSFAEDVCDIVGIINDGALVVVGSPAEIVTSTGVDDLEDAYLQIIGGKIDRTSLLSWR